MSNPAALIRNLKKGELLFKEGDGSRAMYLIQRGMLRIFKQKSDHSQIEIDTLRSGQIIGELAFLDGNPRSASAEALTDCELLEISVPTFTAIMKSMPGWVKILLKTVVGRLRTASTRIRQLESLGTGSEHATALEKKKEFQFLPIQEVSKICATVILVATRHGKTDAGGIEVPLGFLHYYAWQIYNIPLSKITCALDVLAQAGMVSAQLDTTESGGPILKDIDLLDRFTHFLNNENQVEPSKRRELSPKSFLAMSLIARYIQTRSAEFTGPEITINLNQAAGIELKKTGTSGCKIDDFQELVNKGYHGEIHVRTETELFTKIEVKKFMQAYRYQKLWMYFQTMNQKKRLVTMAA